MSVSYTRSDNNDKPVAIEIKLEKDKEMLRNRQTTSQKKLHEYIDKMFEREQREKEKLQVYLQQKKLEWLEYLEQSRKKAQERKRNKSSYNLANPQNIDENKLQRTDEFFKHLKTRDFHSRHLSSSKLEPIQISSQSKQRVKWQDSLPEQLQPNTKIGRYYSRDHLNIEKRENENGSKLKLQYYSDNHPEYKSQAKAGENPDVVNSKYSRHKKLNSRNKERQRK